MFNTQKSWSSLGTVVCELPLLEGVGGFAVIKAQSVAMRPRLQAHVFGEKVCDEVLRLHREKQETRLMNKPSVSDVFMLHFYLTVTFSF